MYLFFDTETTGLPKNWKAPITDLDNWPRMVQIAWIMFDNQGIEITAENYIIRPEGFTIPEETARIHGITTQRALEEGNSLISVLKQFKETIDESRIIIAHNIDFDEKIIGAEFLRNNIYNPIEEKQKICTMYSTIDFCAIKSKYGNKWPKLTELHYKLFESDFEDAHDAETDIRITAKCFWELKKRAII
ncbi:MAG: 3'-5' exonuclease [Candidatus Paceibacterota bacterium]